jgi:CO/xanthine dehydrogenase Mo-binding subunit
MAAIANAIGNATGVRPRSLPMSPPRLLKLLDEAKG